MRNRPLVILLTGLSGSGKSTIASGIKSRLEALSISCVHLDGDQLRQGVCSDLGFTAADRSENVRRAIEFALSLLKSSQIVICSLISPYQHDRSKARQKCQDSGITFLEVFVDAPLQVCEERDPKGLYKKARTGMIKDFTGIDSVFERPETPDLVLKTDQETVTQSVLRLESLLKIGDGKLNGTSAH